MVIALLSSKFYHFQVCHVAEKVTKKIRDVYPCAYAYACAYAYVLLIGVLVISLVGVYRIELQMKRKRHGVQMEEAIQAVSPSSLLLVLELTSPHL